MSFHRCSAAAAGGSAAALVLHRQEQANTQASQPARPVRVLVTGFHDWRELGDVSPNLWRCRDNPSCRLLLGPTSSAPPVKRDGELPRLLRTDAPEVEFVFQTLTTTWGTSNGLDLTGFDAVFHLGLGVYDSRSKVLVENGAWNGRAGKDAAGHVGGATIESGAGAHFLNEKMSLAAMKVDGTTVGSSAATYAVEAASARPSNSYICNETHWRALKALQLASEKPGSSRLKSVFFVHIPVPDKTDFASEIERASYDAFRDTGRDTDYKHLARAVADVVLRLVDETVTA
jgi:hypothetical protein